MESRFLILPHEVSEEDFSDCNTTAGYPVAANYTAEVIPVPKLGVGRHYFISKYYALDINFSQKGKYFDSIAVF